MKARKWIGIGAGALALLLLIAWVVAGNLLFELMVRFEEFEDETVQAAKYTYEDDRLDWLDMQNHQDWSITSGDGIKLNGIYIAAPQPAGRTALVVHGYGGNARNMLRIGRMFVEDLGYNVLLPNLRALGASHGEIIGFGWLDRKDMLLWIQRVLQQQGPDEQIVLYGNSMGGATVMMTSGEKLPRNVKAVIEDCGYTDAGTQIRHQLKSMSLPLSGLLEKSLSLVCKVRAGYFLGEASAVKQLRKTTLPMLFIHGEQDDFVPFEMVYTLYDAANGPKQIYTVPGAEHVASYQTDPAAYRSHIQAFLQQYMPVD